MALEAFDGAQGILDRAQVFLGADRRLFLNLNLFVESGAAQANLAGPKATSGARSRCGGG